VQTIGASIYSRAKGTPSSAPKQRAFSARPPNPPAELTSVYGIRAPNPPTESLPCGDRAMNRRTNEVMRGLAAPGLKPLRRPPACLQHARNQWGILTWGWKPQAATLRAFSTRGLRLRGGLRLRIRAPSARGFRERAHQPHPTPQSKTRSRLECRCRLANRITFAAGDFATRDRRGRGGRRQRPVPKCQQHRIHDWSGAWSPRHSGWRRQCPTRSRPRRAG
jgi:hypothetical protein